jgi:hypothetical protein
MSIDTEFLQRFVGFLDEAFPEELSAVDTVRRTDIMIYGLATRLASLIGTKMDFLDWKTGNPCDDNLKHHPISDQGAPGGVGPRRIEKLVAYAVEVASPELANAYLEHPVVR